MFPSVRSPEPFAPVEPVSAQRYQLGTSRQGSHSPAPTFSSYPDSDSSRHSLGAYPPSPAFQQYAFSAADLPVYSFAPSPSLHPQHPPRSVSTGAIPLKQELPEYPPYSWNPPPYSTSSSFGLGMTAPQSTSQMFLPHPGAQQSTWAYENYPNVIHPHATRSLPPPPLHHFTPPPPRSSFTFLPPSIPHSTSLSSPKKKRPRQQ